MARIWQTISCYHPEVKVVALQMMPDHLHAVLFVREKMEKPLGKVLLGVKQACNRAFREVMPEGGGRCGTATCTTGKGEWAAICEGV